MLASILSWLESKVEGRETLGCGGDRVAGHLGGKHYHQRVQLPEVKRRGEELGGFSYAERFFS